MCIRDSAYPDHWNGVLSVDDACRSWYSDDPANCGVGLSTSYATQIMHQPAWSLFDAIKLAGVEPTAKGYAIDPHFPMKKFSVRLPKVGVEAAPGMIRGYVRPEGGGVLRMQVEAPGRHVRAFADGKRVPAKLRRGTVSFRLPAVAGAAADWKVVAK